MPNTYMITGLKNQFGFARKIRRSIARGESDYRSITVRGNTVIVVTSHRPWGELSGHMTWDTEIIQQKGEEYA